MKDFLGRASVAFAPEKLSVRGQPLIYDLMLLLTPRRGLGAEQSCMRFRLELQIRREDPFKQKLSKFSFDSFCVKFRMNR